MACGSYTLGGLAVGCSDNMGGIKSVQIASYPTSGVTFTENSGGTEITGITGLAPTDWKTYEFRKQSSGMETSTAINDVEGTVLFTTNLNLKFSKMETAKRSEIMAMILGGAIVKVLDQNGNTWVLGRYNPVTATAAAGATGVNYGDGNSYTITLTDLSRELPKQFKGA